MFKPFLITAQTLSAFSYRPYFSNSTINRCPVIMFLWGYRNLSFQASWRYAVWSSRLMDPRCSSEILSFQYSRSSGHSTEYFSLCSLLINFSWASRMSSAFSFLRSSARRSVSWASCALASFSFFFQLQRSSSLEESRPAEVSFRREDSFFLGFFGQDSLSQFSSSSRNLCTTSSPTHRVALS